MTRPQVFDHTAFKLLAENTVSRPSPYDGWSDEDVVAHSILPVRPVTSQKNIWAYWHTGWDTMPGWRQRTVIDWARRQGPSWQVRVLDAVPDSPWHFTKWTSQDLYPASMTEAGLAHGHAAQHVSDAVRLATVIEHGGAFIDPGLMLFCDLEDICWRAICDPNDDLEVMTGIMTSELGPDMICQTLLAARKNDPWLRAWLEIYAFLWKDATSSEHLSTHPILAGIPQVTLTKILLDFCGHDTTHVAFNDYIIHALSAGRVMRIEDPDDTKFSCSKYYRKHVRFLSNHEIVPSHPVSAGEFACTDEELYGRLGSQYSHEEREGGEQERLLRGLMKRFCRDVATYKLTSGIQVAPTLARLWNADPEADIAPGTWAEYLRWSRIHTVQQREIRLIHPDGPELWRSHKIYKAGLYEIITPKTEFYEIPRPNRGRALEKQPSEETLFEDSATQAEAAASAKLDAVQVSVDTLEVA